MFFSPPDENAIAEFKAQAAALVDASGNTLDPATADAAKDMPMPIISQLVLFFDTQDTSIRTYWAPDESCAEVNPFIFASMPADENALSSELASSWNLPVPCALMLL